MNINYYQTGSKADFIEDMARAGFDFSSLDTPTAENTAAAAALAGRLEVTWLGQVPLSVGEITDPEVLPEIVYRPGYYVKIAYMNIPFFDGVFESTIPVYDLESFTKYL